jgi:CubicO group peptidase (beta-lactamase class C family)
MIKRILTFLLLVLSINFSVKAQAINKAKLDSFLNALSINNKCMGSLAISQNGIVYQKAVGYITANGDAKNFANIKTKYRIGSISKIFTGVILFQLIEEGKITLETTLDKYYPQLPNASKITIGQMLSHHSGLFNITSDPAFLSYMTTPQTHEQLVAKMAALTPKFEPGAKYEYSNTNFILLSYIIEKITNKPYAEVVKQRVCSKIELKDTYYGAKINTANNEALSLNFADSWKELPQTDMSIPSGAGAMVSTPADLVKFIEALFAGKLVSNASLEQMKPLKENYGMAMHKVLFDDKIGYGHGGAIDGFRSELAYFPQENLTIAYTSNGGVYSSDKVLKGVLSILFNKAFSIPSFKILALKTEDLDKYIGVYGSPTFPSKITVTKNNTTLYGQAAGQSPLTLVATGKDKFEFEPADIVMEFNPEKSQFTLKQRGKVTLFTKEM